MPFLVLSVNGISILLSCLLCVISFLSQSGLNFTFHSYLPAASTYYFCLLCLCSSASTPVFIHSFTLDLPLCDFFFFSLSSTESLNYPPLLSPFIRDLITDGAHGECEISGMHILNTDSQVYTVTFCICCRQTEITAE